MAENLTPSQRIEKLQVAEKVSKPIFLYYCFNRCVFI